jgi:hypothetical protein
MLHNPGPKKTQTAGRPGSMNRSLHEMLWCHIDMQRAEWCDKWLSSVFTS